MPNSGRISFLKADYDNKKNPKNYFDAVIKIMKKPLFRCQFPLGITFLKNTCETLNAFINIRQVYFTPSSF